MPRLVSRPANASVAESVTAKFHPALEGETRLLSAGAPHGEETKLQELEVFLSMWKAQA
jgi:hypothetical protein